MASWDFTADSELQLEISDKLSTAADSFDGKVKELYNQIDSMGSNSYWVGEDYDSFKEGTNGYKNALSDLADSFRMYSKHFEYISNGTDTLATKLIDIVNTMTTRQTDAKFEEAHQPQQSERVNGLDEATSTTKAEEDNEGTFTYESPKDRNTSNDSGTSSEKNVAGTGSSTGSSSSSASTSAGTGSSTGSSSSSGSTSSGTGSSTGSSSSSASTSSGNSSSTEKKLSKGQSVTVDNKRYTYLGSVPKGMDTGNAIYNQVVSGYVGSQVYADENGNVCYKNSDGKMQRLSNDEKFNVNNGESVNNILNKLED